MRVVFGLLFIILTGVVPVFAQITGVVLDRSTLQPLDGANIAVNPGGYGTATDNNGEFFIDNLAEGIYEICISYIGYEGITLQKIRITDSAIKRIHISLIPSVLEMEEVMVTGKRGPSLTWELPISAEVISSRDIQRINAVSVADAVRPASGVFIHSYGHLAGIKSLSVRGSSAEQVLILKDGARINSPLLGGFDLALLPLASVDKIEFVRSGLSSLYGADAAAGVINLISRSAPTNGKPYGSINISYGAMDSKYYQAQASQQLGAFSYLISGNISSSKGNYSFVYVDPTTSQKIEGKRQNSDYNMKEISGKIIWESSEQTKINIAAEYATTERGAPGALSYPSPEARQTDTIKRFKLDASTIPSISLT